MIIAEAESSAGIVKAQLIKYIHVIWKENASSKTRAPQELKAPGRGNRVAISPIA